VKKRVLAGAAALLIVGMLIASVGVFSIESEEKPPPREAIWTDTPVKVLGTSAKTVNLRSVLLEATSRVAIINDSINLMNSIQPGDILLIDGHWSKNQPLDRLSTAVKNVILKGNPVLLVLGDPLLLKTAVEGENISHGWGDNRLVYGIKYSPDHDYSVTFGCGSQIITDTVIRNAILDGLDWAAENIRNDLVRAYDGPFDPALYGTTSQAYWDYVTTIDETEYCYPHGNFRIIASYHQLIGDSTPSYNWYSSQLKLISIPGELLWDNNYQTGDM